MRHLGSFVLLSMIAGCTPTKSNFPPATRDLATGAPADFAGMMTTPDDMAMSQMQGDDLAMMQGGGDDMASMCSTPGTLHPPKMGMPTIYCPFSGVMGGKPQYCTAGTQHCCEPATGTAACQPSAMACAVGDTDWQCQDPVADCPRGEQCCGSGKLVVNANPMCANYASGFHGTHCAANCAANEIRMCTSDAECGGKTCIPFKTKGAQVGGCG
jgi:hypothetical protein